MSEFLEIVKLYPNGFGWLLFCAGLAMLVWASK